MTAVDVRDGQHEPTTALSPSPGRRLTTRQKVVVLGVLLAIAAAAVAGLVFRIAGGGGSFLPPIGGNSDMARYQFSIYGVARPLGVAVNSAGDRIYVTESEGTRLTRVFDRSGKQVGTLRPPGLTLTAHLPVYAAVEPVSGEVYVSDRIRQTIDVYDASGAHRRQFKPSLEALGGGWQPLGLAFDDKRRLYVSDVSGPTQRVLQFGPNGKLLRTFAPEDSLSFPNGLTVDGDGNLYVTDSNNGRLLIFTPSGKLAASVMRGMGAGDLGLPRGIAVDGKSRLYVVDATGHTVQLYQAGSQESPKYLGALGEEGLEDAAFEFPNGIAIAGSRIYITDRENNRLQVWEY